ncbi:ribonuclease H-like domain-containing protein [Candidatus Woesearchaeota archaeon]|nr:ribonuclease H-like domain-containing protein [Candidatus Woesearchaeota archaeon]
MKASFYLTDITYKEEDGKAVIYLFGRTKEGQRLIVKDSSFQPYFFVQLKDLLAIDKLKELKLEGCKVLEVKAIKKNYLEKEVVVHKIIVNLPRSVSIIKEEIKKWPEIEQVLEYDVLFTRRYLLDKKITPMTLLKLEGEQINEAAKAPVILATKIEQESEEVLPKIKILALDIETYNPEGKTMNPKKNPIIMLALKGEKYDKVLTWKRINGKNIEVLKNEADLLQRFKEIIEEEKPDVITGYYSDGFDLPYIKERADRYKIKLDLGTDYSELQIRGKTDKVASISGIIHVDVLKFIRRVLRTTLNTDTFNLESVAQELLGEHKHDVPLDLLAQTWDKEDEEKLKMFAEYNLHDANLCYQLCQKLLPNMIELVKVISLSLFDVQRMSFSQLVEWYAIKKAQEFNELIPNKPGFYAQQERIKKRVHGAFVFKPTPGLYSKIVVFDYRSLYPSIIASHNISIGTINCECCKGKKKVPTEFSELWICEKKQGFLSTIIKEIIDKRAEIKKALKQDQSTLLKARSEALKLLANSFYGYLAFAVARWYSFEGAEATTAFARFYIKDLISKAQENGFKVIYSDTDSCFIILENKTKKDAIKFCEEINKNLPGSMELDLQGYYPSGLFVGAKGTTSGAKKKYALLDEKENMIIKGFETVRRNWSFIAKEVQKKVLDIVLKEHNKQKALSYVKETVKKLEKNQEEISKLIIFTQLQKSIDEYENISPHVAAAQLLEKKGQPVVPGTMLKFIICKGEGKIRDKVKLPEDVKQEDYDGEYYIDHQIIPSVESIFSVMGIDVEKELRTKDQTTLAAFSKKK